MYDLGSFLSISFDFPFPIYVLLFFDIRLGIRMFVFTTFSAPVGILSYLISSPVLL